jgi:uncharacterized protein YjbI with pentapeptide repeats
MNDFLHEATRVSTPLGLAGLIASIFFFVLREILRKNIFPQLTKGHSYELLLVVVDRIFKLAIVALVLGFLGFVLSKIRASPQQLTTGELFRIVEDVDQREAARLESFRKLRDQLGVRDFRGRNLSGLSLPSSGWENMDLREADLRNVKLRNANMRGVDLVRVIFIGADLSGSDFRGAQLNGADISNGNCRGAIFTEVWLRAGKYRHTDFSGARLEYSNLEIADFTDAMLADVDVAYALAGGAIFDGADLSSIRNLPLANVESAHFTASTRFPRGFDPRANKMAQQ